jgi:hypothetical protein
VIGVEGKPRIGLGVVERLTQQNFVDRFCGGLDAPRSGQVLTECLSDQVPEGGPTRARRLGGPPVKVSGQKKLRAVHVSEPTSPYPVGNAVVEPTCSTVLFQREGSLCVSATDLSRR